MSLLVSIQTYASQLWFVLIGLYEYFTAEVISNIFETFAFLLVTPEFLPPGRRRHIQDAAQKIAIAIDKFTKRTPFLVLHWILVFPSMLLFSVSLAFLARGLLRWLTSWLPYSAGFGIKIFFLVVWVLAVVGGAWAETRREKDDPLPRYLSPSMMFLGGVAVILSSLKIQVPDTAYEAFPYVISTSLIWISLAAGALLWLSWLLSRVLWHTSFCVGVILFFISAWICDRTCRS